MFHLDVQVIQYVPFRCVSNTICSTSICCASTCNTPSSIYTHTLKLSEQFADHYHRQTHSTMLQHSFSRLFIDSLVPRLTQPTAQNSLATLTNIPGTVMT